jgi:tetratricopeptide (TPR) repeat protein
MDRRASLVLALGLATGVLGCGPNGGLPLASSDPKAVAAPTTAEVPLTPLSAKPHASTYRAAGSLAEKSAEDPNRGPADRENLFEEARKNYQQAIATDPNYLPAYQALARLYLKEGDQERAVATYQKAIKAHPKAAPLWYELGMCYSRQKQWEPALTNLRQAVKLDPENRPYVNTLGYCLARAGLYDESLACFRKIVGPAQAHYNLARMLHHLGRDDLSRQHLQMALQADPRLVPARQLLTQLDGQASGVVPAAAVEVEPNADEPAANPGQ